MPGMMVPVIIKGRGGSRALLVQGKPELLTCSPCSSQLLLCTFVMPSGDEADGVIASLARREDRSSTMLKIAIR